MSKNIEGEANQRPAIIFRETQKFRQPAFWIFIFLAGGAFISAATYFAARRIFFGPAADGVTIAGYLLGGGAAAALVIGVLLLFLYARLVVEVRADGLQFYFFPFHRKPFRVPAGDIKSVEVKTFQSVAELRAWGKRSLPRDHIFTVSGNQGVFLELAADKNYFIGTQRPDKLAHALTLMAEGRGNSAAALPPCAR